jgi:hypothetical protein
MVSGGVADQVGEGCHELDEGGRMGGQQRSKASPPAVLLRRISKLCRPSSSNVRAVLVVSVTGPSKCRSPATITAAASALSADERHPYDGQCDVRVHLHRRFMKRGLLAARTAASMACRPAGLPAEFSYEPYGVAQAGAERSIRQLSASDPASTVS